MYKAKILSNLENHHGKWVNTMCVSRGLRGCNYVDDLNELIQMNAVETKTVVLQQATENSPAIKGVMYRISPFGPRSGKLHLVE